MILDDDVFLNPLIVEDGHLIFVLCKFGHNLNDYSVMTLISIGLLSRSVPGLLLVFILLFYLFNSLHIMWSSPDVFYIFVIKCWSLVGQV